MYIPFIEKVNKRTNKWDKEDQEGKVSFFPFCRFAIFEQINK